MIKRASKRYKRETHQENISLKPGLVIASHGANVEVEDEKKHVHTCISRKKVGVAVCGDQVQWHSEANQTGLIHQIEPRKNLLARPDARNKLKPVAANIDYLAITLAPTPSAIKANETELDSTIDLDKLFDFHAIDRYIVAAEVSNIQALIIINKIDLLPDHCVDELHQRLSRYTPLDYPYILASTKKGTGLKELNDLLKDNNNVFVGQSGVGKSSIIKTFVTEEDIQVGTLSKVTGQGRHTTTATRLYHLKSGGSIIDSPGVREFGLWNIEPEKIMLAFREFAPYLGYCKFNNCLHTSEPNCAIRDAVANKEIDSQRYEAYKKILASLDEPR